MIDRLRTGVESKLRKEQAGKSSNLRPVRLFWDKVGALNRKVLLFEGGCIN